MSKNKIGLYAMYGFLAAMAADEMKNIESNNIPVEPEPEKNKPLYNGMKIFIIDGKEIPAINKKNAIRKASKYKK